MGKCLITHSAVEAIRMASLPAHQSSRETGGMLIGPTPDDGLVVITSATGPGPDDSNSSYASWETDPEYLNGRLRMAQEENPAVNLRGFWHLHPGQMTHPSGQDLREACNILEDTRHYKLNGGLVMPIVTAQNGRITIHCHYISRSSHRFTEIPFEIIDDTDDVIATASDRGMAEIEVGAESGFWQDPGWQFYGMAYGAERLAEELDVLESAGYQVTARILDDGDCCVQVCGDGGGKSVLFLLPREYPLNPPRIFLKSGKRIRELPAASSTLLYGWSSAFRLAELMDGKLGNQIRLRSHAHNSLSDILADLKKDFRRGLIDIPGTIRRLAALIRTILSSEEWKKLVTIC